jgi:RNA polymerase sigma factor (sigma-70 family)
MTVDEVFRQCGPLVWKLARDAAARYGGEPADWRQYFWVDLSRHVQEYDPARASLSTWVTLRTRNVTSHRQSYLTAAKRAKQTATGCELPAWVLDPRAVDPAELVETREQCEAVRRMLAALPLREGVAVAAEFGILPGPESRRAIGAALGITPSRVGQLVRDGLALLAGEMDATA